MLMRGNKVKLVESNFDSSAQIPAL